MYDLKFYSEYFFRASPEIVGWNLAEDLPDKDKQQLLNESASAAQGLVRSTERTVSPEHSVGAQIKTEIK